ncbi:MAG: TatD family hydrolase [Armatimonadota bacterium]|nr:TatD family hydrolase [Armatimonadota bacterium]MDR5697025.1 TatD family hydrolase [Armatimonadota bacterium]
MVDTHLHLDNPQFDGDREAVVERALHAGVWCMITMGVDLASSRRAVALAETYDAVFAAVGIHPNQAHRAGADDLARIRELADHPRVVAIGECGLDYYRGWCPPEVQRANLRAHIRLSNEIGKPLVVHNREAHADVMRILEEEQASRVVLHAFGGPADHTAQAAERGYWMGLGGSVTYPNAHQVRAAAREIPSELLLVETDAPYLPPEPHRGRRNEPAYLPRIVTAIAKERGHSLQTVGGLAGENALRCFGIRMR